MFKGAAEGLRDQITSALTNALSPLARQIQNAVTSALSGAADGISDIWRKASDRKIMIPMLGRLDSLNVSVSAAILCYEALRQRSSR